MINKWGRALTWKKGPETSPLSFSALKRLEAIIPASKSLKRYCSPIKDQGKAGSCVAFGVCGAEEFLQKNSARLGITDAFSEKSLIKVSELFAYYHNREKEGTINEDSGSYIYTGIKTAATNGFCRSTLWPYDLNNMYTHPPKSAEADGLLHLSRQGFTVRGISEIEKCIASGYPVIIGTELTPSFMNVGQDGLYDGPYRYEKSIGGHCMLIVGYSKNTKRMLLRNSWGTEYGKRGYVSVTYDMAEGFDDCHTLR